MPHKIELHGWTDLSIPTEALFDLTSRSYKLYGYLVFRARDKSSAYPGQDRIAEELSSDDEKWSKSTVKRSFSELVTKDWIVRDRRVGTSSLTHIFKSKYACECFREAADAARRTMDEPTVGPQVSRQSDHGRSVKDDSVKDDSVNPSGEPETGEPKPKKQTDWQLFCGGIAQHMFGIDIENAALVEANMGRIGPVASALRKVHRALVGDDKATPTPDDVRVFVERWYTETDVNLPLGEKSTPPHWSRLMAPGWVPANVQGDILPKAAPGAKTYE